MAGFANLVVLDLECPDPSVLAEFYSGVLGWEVGVSQDDYVEISDGSTRILLHPGGWLTGGRGGRPRTRRSATTCACRRMTGRRPRVP